MRRLGIVGIWLVVIIIDGIVLPALSGLPSGLGIMVFLSALAITFGIHRWVISWGIVMAGATELILGAGFGTIIGSWLVVAWVWYLLNRFLNMKPLSENDSFLAFILFILLGLGLLAIGEGALWVITRLAYQSDLSTSTLFHLFRAPTILSIVAVELGVTLFVFRFIYSPKNLIYAQ